MRLSLARSSVLDRIGERLFASLNGDALSFPTSTASLVRLIDRAGSEGCGIDEAASLVQAEPLVAARTVALANSAAYNRSGRSITNVREALGLLGIRTLKAITGAVIMRQLADRAAAPNQAVVTRLWAHSVEVAALAAVLCRRFTDVPSDTALFAGIVHEIGGFYVLAHASDVLDLTPDVVGSLREDPAGPAHRSETLLALGTRRLLAALELPEEVAQVIESQWSGYVMLPPESLGDALVVAKLMAATPSPFEPRKREELVEGLDLDLVLEETQVMAVLRERYEEVRAIQQVFAGR